MPVDHYLGVKQSKETIEKFVGKWDVVNYIEGYLNFEEFKEQIAFVIFLAFWFLISDDDRR
jgi:hypothetical protein